MQSGFGKGWAIAVAEVQSIVNNTVERRVDTSLLVGCGRPHGKILTDNNATHLTLCATTPGLVRNSWRKYDNNGIASWYTRSTFKTCNT